LRKIVSNETTKQNNKKLFLTKKSEEETTRNVRLNDSNTLQKEKENYSEK
jgi:hypothetical protein